MKIDLEKLRNKKKYIGCQKHPTLDLLVWNYTHKCQHDAAWDDETMVARGLITDLEGNIISRPLRKFFNIGERDNTPENLILLGEPKIYEKLDGSLGIQYYDGDIPQIATRGSFTSDQAKWASNWIESRYVKDDFLEGHTYLYEIIYPENRIVVDYSDRAELVLLAVIETESGGEVDYISEAKKLGLSYAVPFDKSMDEFYAYVAKMNSDEEGFVLVYPNKLRVKVKGEEYCRLHKILSGVSSISVWESLKILGNISALITVLPSNIHNWAYDTEAMLEIKYERVSNNAYHAIQLVTTIPDRKNQAIFIMEHCKEISSILFAMLDDKEYKHIIWKMIKPKYEKPTIGLEENSDYINYDEDQFDNF